MKEKIKKYIGEILLLIGVFAFIYNIFNFSSSRGCGILADYGIGETCSNPVAYFYKSNVLFMISLGAVLFTSGILITKRRDKKL